MSKKRERGLTRRQLAKLAGAGALVAGGPAFLFPDRARAAGKTLKIIQWSHFVPAWDTWFNGTYTKEWGQKNNTKVIVDNINLVDLPARRRRRSLGEEGPRPLHVPVPAGGLREAGHRHDARVPGGGEEAREEDRPGAQVHVQPEDEEVLRLLGRLHARSRQLAQGLVDGGGLPQRARHLRRPAEGSQEDPRRDRPPVRRRPLAGARHQHGHARPAVVLRRGRAGRGRKRDDQFQADRRSPEVHEGALPADGDAGGLHLDSALEQPGHARGKGQLRGERHLDHAPVREREDAHRQQDHDQPGAERARCGGSPPSTS